MAQSTDSAGVNGSGDVDTSELDLLLSYISRGWAVLPIHTIERGECTCGRRNKCTAPGKHPRTLRGVKDASNDPMVIKAWHRDFPRTNWAVACGSVSNVVVVDIDPRHGGDASLEQYEGDRTDGPLPLTLKQRTGGGGWHLFFTYDPRLRNRTNWLPGVDVKADDGYVLIPPSNHIKGRGYHWVNTLAPVALPPDVIADVAQASERGNDSNPLPDTATILQGVAEGKRDEVLFRAACRWRRQLQDDRAAVTVLVLEAARNCEPPFPRDEALRKVDQAFKQDHRDGDDNGGRRLTDDGNALRLIDQYGDRLRYVDAWGWLQWDGTRWRIGSDSSVIALARMTVYGIRDDEATQVLDSTRRAALLKWAQQSESAGKIAAMMQLARSDERVHRDPRDFDNDPWLLNCSNGIVDLRTGELLPHDRNMHFTRSTHVMYDPECDTSYWESFMEQACDYDPELVRYMQRVVGYTLTGHTSMDTINIIYGPTASGKSTFMDGLGAAMGSYAVATQSETLMMKWGGQSTPRDELARFAGARLVSTTEVPEGERFSESLIKQLTGGDTVSARFLYRDTFEYKPQFKLYIATNHAPIVRDEAIWRRIKRIPFPITVPPERRIPHLRQWVRHPSGGARQVLAWAVRGAVEWAKCQELPDPAAVRMETDDYRREQDRFGQFIDETCIKREDAVVTFNQLWQRYRAYCDMLGERPMAHTTFKIKLQERGFARTRVGAGMAYRGLELKVVSTYGT